MCQIIDSFRFTCEKTMVIANTRKDARGCIWIKKDFSGERKSHSVVSNSLRPHGLFSPCSSPGQNTGVGYCFLHQGIFPAQWLNFGLLYWRQILYWLSHGVPQWLRWWRICLQWRSPGSGNGYLLQCFCLEIPVDRGGWWVTIRGVTQSQKQLSNLYLYYKCIYLY